MRISAGQLEAIARNVALESFEEEMLEALPRRSPWLAARLGSLGLRRALRFGVARAGHYGVTNAGLLRTYVELMVTLGSFFDVDPLLPWARQALGDPAASGEQARMDRLYAGAVAFFRAVTPLDEGEGPLRGFEDFLHPEGGARSSSEHDVVDALHRLHPTLSAHVGDGALLGVVRSAALEAARLGIGVPGGVTTVAGLAIALGCGFADDPLYPWIRTTLDGSPPDRPLERIERLRLAIRANAPPKAT